MIDRDVLDCVASFILFQGFHVFQRWNTTSPDSLMPECIALTEHVGNCAYLGADPSDDDSENLSILVVLLFYLLMGLRN